MNPKWKEVAREACGGAILIALACLMYTGLWELVT